MKNVKTWFTTLKKLEKTLVIGAISLVSIIAVGVSAEPNRQPVDVKQPISTPSVAGTSTTSTPRLEKKTLTSTETIAFTSSIIEDPALAQGVTQVRTAGINGIRTLTYEVNYTDGVEVTRQQINTTVTTEPVNEVIAKGTKVPTSSCPNGTYVNTYGNTVCRPYETSGVPAGATALCRDGTYSFSQSRRGTCSSHGGVARWL